MLQISYRALFAIFGHQLYFPQGIEATEKLEHDHAVNVEALKEELAKVKSAGEEIILNISHAFSSEALFYKAPSLFGHCITFFTFILLFSLTRCGINTKDGTTIHDYNLKDVKEVLEHREEY